MDIKQQNRPRIKKVQWKEIRKEVEAVNKPLAKIIDDLDPKPEYALYKASYPFGCETVREGRLHIPNEDGEMLPLQDPRVPEEFRRELSYNVGTNPVCLILKNQFEVYLELREHTLLLPTGLHSPGNIYSISRVLSPHGSMHPAFMWSISAGARTMFMLPKISAVAGYKKLKRKFDIPFEGTPKTLPDHWDIFKGIANHPSFKDPWSAELIYFGKKWFEHFEDKAWQAFARFFYKIGWDTTEYYRSQFVWDLIYSLIKEKKRLKPNPYIDDTVKHLIAMGVSAAPGFAPATNNDAGPVSRFQEVFKHDYKLENYAPIIMQPKLLSHVKNDAIYYSLSYPTTTEFAPSTRTLSNKITYLLETKYLMEKYLEELAKNNLNISETPMANLSSAVKYDYFHTEYKSHTGILSTDQIVEDDPLFATLCKESKGNAFPTNSSFINGCIRIMRK
jgi:hypothetical protein